MTATENQQTEIIDRARYRQILWFFGGLIANIVWWDLIVGRIFQKRVRKNRPDRFPGACHAAFRLAGHRNGGRHDQAGPIPELPRGRAATRRSPKNWLVYKTKFHRFPMKDVASVLNAELGDLSDHFTYFEEEPLAAASLGQAHCARLVSPDGINMQSGNGSSQAAVVVKVQRPNIEDIVSTDLAALHRNRPVGDALQSRSAAGRTYQP